MSIGNFKLFGLPDFCALPAMDLTAGSEASADFPATNAKTEIVTDTWRSDGYAFFDCWLKAEAGYEGGLLEFSAGGFVIVNHNLWPWSGDVRFIAGSGATPPEPEDLWGVATPTAILASTNLDGGAVVADVANGFTPDGDIFTPASLALSSYDFRLSMNSPAGDLQTGADRQAFYIYAKIPSSAAPTWNPSESPTMAVELWESGAFVATLAKKAVCSAEFQWYIFRWDAADLAAISGAGVEIKVTCTINGTPTPERRIAVDEVAWVYEQESAVSGGSGILHDSGWLPAGVFAPSPTGTEKYLPSELTRGDCVAHDVLDVAGATLREIPSVTYFRVMLRDDHSPDINIYNVTTFTVPPPGYVEVGKLVTGGAVFTTAVNFAIGPLDGIKDLSVTKFTQGGSQFGTRNGILRTATVDFPALTRGEKAFLYDRLLRRRGTSRPVPVSLTPGDELESESLTFYATLSQQENTASTQLLEDYRRKLTLNLVEYR